MEKLVNFIIESGISLTLLSLIYLLFLRKETFFRMNRVFLLLSVVFSVILPFLKFKVYEAEAILLPEVTVTPYQNLMEAVTVYGQDFSGAIAQTISSSRLLVVAYLLGLLFFLSRFVLQLGQIAVLIYRNPAKQVGTIKFILVNKNASLFSFLNYIFITPDKQQESGYEEIIAHEMEHIKQGHSFDVLVLEFLTIIQWFNPFVWLLKKVIRENHEFSADKAVLQTGVSAAQYKYLLLNQTFNNQLYMGNSFNTSLIKNRIKMITKIRSSKFANLKYAMGAFAALLLIIVFACEQKQVIGAEEIKKENTKSVKVLMIEGKLKLEGDKASMKRIYDFINSDNKYDIEVNDSLNTTYLVRKKAVSKTLEAGEQIFLIVEDMPKFPGGDSALRKYIAGQIKYPLSAQKKGIQGKVYISFVVSKTGQVTNAKVVRGVDPIIDKEALRVVNSLPRWSPGLQGGEAVNVSYTVPINFSL